MTSTLSAPYHQGKFQATVAGGKRKKKKKKRREQRKYIRDELNPYQNVLETSQDRSVKQIVSQNFNKSINNQTYGKNTGKINQFFQSSIQVRYQNMEYVHS